MDHTFCGFYCKKCLLNYEKVRNPKWHMFLIQILLIKGQCLFHNHSPQITDELTKSYENKVNFKMIWWVFLIKKKNINICFHFWIFFCQDVFVLLFFVSFRGCKTFLRLSIVLRQGWHFRWIKAYDCTDPEKYFRTEGNIILYPIFWMY